MAICGECVKPVTSKQLKLKCSDCEREFHAQCYRMSKADVDCINADELPWRCKNCAEKRRKSLRFDSEVQEGKLTLEDIMLKISEMAEAQKLQEINFNKSYEVLSDKMDENTKSVNNQNQSLEKCLARIDGLVEENKKLTKRVIELEKKLEDMEQYSRLNAVEIHGIPEERNEDIVNVVMEVGKGLNMEITESMIDICHRLGRRPGPGNPPPAIIVKFVRRLDKEDLLKRRRVKSNFSTRHMNLKMDQPVYINEALTPERRRLLAEARRKKRSTAFCGSAMGRSSCGGRRVLQSCR